MLNFPVGVGASGAGILTFTDTAKWYFGSPTVMQTYNVTVEGLTFQRPAIANGAGILAGSSFIDIERVRGLRIAGYTFAGADKAVYVRPTVGITAHENADIIITENKFGEVNYAWYVDLDAAATWQATADSRFINNTINRAYVVGVFIAAIDGLHIIGNTMFFPN